MQKGYFNLNFLTSEEQPTCIRDATKREQFVPLLMKGPYGTTPFFCMIFEV